MSQYIELTEANFDQQVLESKEPVLVDFWADWCGPCHVVAPVIEQLAADFAGRAKVGKVNVDQAQDLAQRYEVRAIPTLLFFQDGKVVRRRTGAAPRKTLEADLNELLPVAK